MKLILKKGANSVAGAKLMRLAGFIYIVDRKFGKHSYSRPLGNYHYPRFHAYLEESADNLIINLHLDQKQASYEGFKRHSGEYDGATVGAEIARLRQMAIASGFVVGLEASQRVARPAKAKSGKTQIETAHKTLQTGDYHQAAKLYEAKKSWWRKLINN